MSIGALARDAIALGSTRGRAVLGIAGSPGAGKTTLVELLLEHIDGLCGPGWAAHVPMDGFHLADVQLRRLGALGRKGAPDTFDVDGYASLLARARADVEKPLYVPGFERTLEQPLAAALVVLPQARLVITEGNYLLLDDPGWRAARRQMDVVWFVAADEGLRTERLVDRHVAFGKSAEQARDWVTVVDQRNADLVSATQHGADRVIANGRDGWRPA